MVTKDAAQVSVPSNFEYSVLELGEGYVVVVNTSKRITSNTNTGTGESNYG